MVIFFLGSVFIFVLFLKENLRVLDLLGKYLFNLFNYIIVWLGNK